MMEISVERLKFRKKLSFIVVMKKSKHEKQRESVKKKYEIIKAINYSLTENCIVQLNYLNNTIENFINKEQDMNKVYAFYAINSSLVVIKAKICDSWDCRMIKKGKFQAKMQTIKIRETFWELLSTYQ